MGAGKQTVYRWWPSKADVLLDALAEEAELHVPVDDHGAYRAGLEAFLKASVTLGRNPLIIDVLRALMAHAQVDADFGERFRERFLQRRRDALAVIIERAAARGDLPPHPAREMIADIVFGVIWYRMLTRPEPFDKNLTRELVSTIAPDTDRRVVRRQPDRGVLR